MACYEVRFFKSFYMQPLYRDYWWPLGPCKTSQKPVGVEKLRDNGSERVSTADSSVCLRDDPVLYPLRWTKVFWKFFDSKCFNLTSESLCYFQWFYVLAIHPGILVESSKMSDPSSITGVQ